MAKRRASRLTFAGSESKFTVVQKDQRPLSGAKYNFRSVKFTRGKLKNEGFKDIRQSRYTRMSDYERLKNESKILKPYIYTMMNQAKTFSGFN